MIIVNSGYQLSNEISEATFQIDLIIIKVFNLCKFNVFIIQQRNC